MYEIWSLGYKPFEELTNIEVNMHNYIRSTAVQLWKKLYLCVKIISINDEVLSFSSYLSV